MRNRQKGSGKQLKTIVYPYNRNFMPSYSIVVPLHNEQENVTDLYDRLKAVMEVNGGSFELVMVDDGSVDGTFEMLREIAAVDSRVTVVKLRRNFGQTSALAAGFDHARGEYIIAMDGDLQHDPADIPLFLEKIAEGYDIVSGWRKQRIDNLWLRRIPSRCANWLMAKLSGVDIHDFGTTFKAYRREILEQVPLYGELHRFIPALASWHGASICEVPIRNVMRERGNSHYGISRTFRVFFDLITIRFLLRYLARPLHFFGTLGMMSIFAGSGVSLWLLAEKFLNHRDVMSNHGPLMIFAAVLLLAGFNMLAIGLLGEMQVRHYYEPRRRGPYSVDRVFRSQSEEHTIPE
jgi:glycosyltransferase involved in cell wall biosynthesis